jgi:Raf kinase inhibitor-like YbhB/YbcL family protein
MLTLAAVALSALHLSSSTFSNGGTLPGTAAYAKCGGANVSPALRWSGVPAGTKSFALVMHDPDAPVWGGWYHWVVYDLPLYVHSLAAGASLRPAELGNTSFGDRRYGGPCPPPGKPHHYVFTLYALDEARIAASAPLRGAELEAKLRGHVLARATITGLFASPR